MSLERLRITKPERTSAGRDRVYPKSARKILQSSQTTTASSPLYSLAKFSSLKSKLSLHNLDYKEISHLPHSRSKISSAANSRENSILGPKTTTNLNLDLTNLKNPPKIKRVANIPPEKRQIIVEKYLSAAKNPSVTKLNLDNVWYQTLKEPNFDDFHDFSSPAKLGPNLQSQSITRANSMTPNKYSRNSSSPMEFSNFFRSTTNDGLKFLFEKVDPKFSPAKESIFSSMIETTNTRNIFKPIEKLSSTIKDFEKMIQYMEKTKSNILKEQEHLHEFVLTFVKEFDSITKTPTRTASRTRLNDFQNVIKAKIEELRVHQDLLFDQTGKIKNMCYQGAVQMRNSINGSIMSFGGIDEGTEATNSISDLSSLARKRDKVKEQVQALQAEREESESSVANRFIRTINLRRTLSQSPACTPKNQGSASTTPKIRSSIAAFSEEAEPKNTKRSSLSNFPVVLSGFAARKISDIREENLSASRNLDEHDKSLDLLKSALMHKNTTKASETKRNDTSLFEDFNSDTEDTSNTNIKKINHREIQMFLTAAVEGLEEKFKVTLEDLKVFELKDPPKEGEEKQKVIRFNWRDKTINEEVMDRIDSFNDECKRYLLDSKRKRSNFLKDLSSYFGDIEEILTSNLLKLSSLDHLISTLVDKLFQILEYKSNVNPVDMTDKEVRKVYNSGFASLKQELEQMREAALFIAQKIGKTLPHIEHGAEFHQEYLSSLSVRGNQMARGIHYLARFPEIDQSYDNSMKEAKLLYQQGRKAVKTLREEVLEKQNYNCAKDFDGVLDHHKKLVIVSKNLNLSVKEMTAYSVYPFFKNKLKKPLMLLENLFDDIRIHEKHVNDSIEQARESIVVYYNSLVRDVENINEKLNSFVERELVEKKRYLEFDSYLDVEQQLNSILDLMVEPKKKIEILAGQEYPQCILFVPEPSDRLKFICLFEERVDAAVKLIGLGKYLNNNTILPYLREITSRNVTEKLSVFRKNINDQLHILEVIAGSPIISVSPSFQVISREALMIVLKLKNLLKKVWECSDVINQAYHIFRLNYESRSVCDDTDYKSLVATLNKIYTKFHTYLREKIGYGHKIFRKLSDVFQEMTSNELSIVANLQKNIANVNENQKDFDFDAMPVTNLSKFYNSLDKWPEMVHFYKEYHKKWKVVLENLSEIGENIYFRWELRKIANDYDAKQRSILVSMEILLLFFELGRIFSAESLKSVLNIHIKDNKSQYASFLADLEEILERMQRKAEVSKREVDPSFEAFVSSTLSTLRHIYRYLRDLQEKYVSVPEILVMQAKQLKGDFVAEIKSCKDIIKLMSSEFTKQLCGCLLDFEEKPDFIHVIEDFLKNVLERDANVYEKIYAESKKMAEFIRIVRTEFFKGELRMHNYRKLTTLESKPMELNRDKCKDFITHLDRYIQTDEVKHRSTMRNLLNELKDLFTDLSHIFEVFRIFHSEGREIHAFIETLIGDLKSNAEMEVQLTVIHKKIKKMIGEMYRANKKRTRSHYFQISFEDFQLDYILEKDIISFFQDILIWTDELKSKVVFMKNFEIDLEKNYKRKVVWMQDDFPEFLRKWSIDENSMSFEKGRSPSNDYEGLWQRMKAYEEELQTKRIMVREKFLEHTAYLVEFANKNIFNEWFFKMDNGEQADKIIPKLYRFVEKLREKSIKKDDMFRKLFKYQENIQVMMDIVSYFEDKEKLIAAGFIEVRDFEIIKDYAKCANLDVWLNLISLLLDHGEELAKSVNEENEFIEQLEIELNKQTIGKPLEFLRGFREAIIDC